MPAIILLISACSKSSKSEVLVKRFAVMGGVILEIKLYGNSPEEQKLAKMAYNKVAEVDAACNIYKPESELSRLNKTAADRPFKCSLLLWRILKISKKYYEITNGSFDISAGPLIKLWGIHRKNKILPSKDKLDEVKKLMGLDKVIFNDEDKTVKFTVKGMKLDLGGIAKGYAVQLAAEELKKHGVKTGIINLAGNAYCFPQAPSGQEFYTVGIRDPLVKGSVCGLVQMKNQSIATSGNYERFVEINGRKYTHIMDPATCEPVMDMLSVTVVTPNATDSDALSTSIFIKGEAFAEKICKQIPGTSVLIIKRNPKNGKLTTIEKISEEFSENSQTVFSKIVIQDKK